MGLKSGYTKKAGSCFVALAKDEHRTLAVVLLDCPKRDDVYRGSIALFEAAFNEKPVERLPL